MKEENTLFDPEEMQSPFDAIKEVDGEGREWWNSRKLARLMGKVAYWLSQKRMSELFNVALSTINYHLSQIDESSEMQLSAAVKKNLIPSDNCDDAGTILFRGAWQCGC